MKLFWIDCETTGLDPTRDALLELAVAQADLERPFDVGEVFSQVVRFNEAEPVGGEPRFIQSRGCVPPVFDTYRMEPRVLAMHVKSGLLSECSRVLLGVGDLEEYLLDVVPEVTDYGDRPTIAGSSAHFDLAFLRAKVPRAAARFSHRVYDVSAVKLFCRSLGMPKLPRAEAHRAKDDILESIAHARACERWLTGNGRVEYLGQVEYLVRERNVQAKTLIPAIVRLLERTNDEPLCVTITREVP